MVHLMWATCYGFKELVGSLDRSCKQTSRSAHCRVLLASSLQSLLLGANSANLAQDLMYLFLFSAMAVGEANWIGA